NQSAISNQQSAIRGLPWFAWVHFYDAHAPYDPPAPFRARFAAAPYDGEIAYVDSCVGRIVSALEASGRLEDTLVIAIADHRPGPSSTTCAPTRRSARARSMRAVRSQAASRRSSEGFNLDSALQPPPKRRSRTRKRSRAFAASATSALRRRRRPDAGPIRRTW